MKQLLIRNQADGMIWQVYNIEQMDEATILKRNAIANGFFFHEVVEVEPPDAYTETWPGWRETEGWKKLWAEHNGANSTERTPL